MDAETGKDVRQIELVSGTWPFVPTVPSESRRRAESPAELPVLISCCWDASGVWWVRAPGYAWTRTVVDHERGGEHVALLRAGGSVRVQLLGAERKWTAAIYLIGADESGKPSRCVWPTLHPDRPMDLDGLPPGEYTLEVWGSRLLARTTLSVSAGEVTAIELDLAG